MVAALGGRHSPGGRTKGGGHGLIGSAGHRFSLGGQHCRAAPQDLQLHRAGNGGLDGDFDLRGPDGQRTDPHAVHRDTGLVRQVQPNRAIDACSGIPAAVGLFSVVGDDAKFIFRAVGQEWRGIHVEVGIAVGAMTSLLPVDEHLGVTHHALEFEKQRLRLPLLRGVEALHIFIVAADVPADIALGHAVIAAGFGDHSVVRQGHGKGFALPGQASARPVSIEVHSFHRSIPLCHLHD